MDRKYIPAILFVLAVATVVVASAALASGQETKTVLLVSDNEADSAVADAIQNLKHFKIVITPWGEYHESVVSEIDTLEPNNVFIIEGPSAVPSEYEIALNDLGYTTFRISGPTRYETAAAALKHFKNDFKGKGVVIAFGFDSNGIRKALEKAKRHGGFILFVKNDDVPDEVDEALEDAELDGFEIEESPEMDGDEIEKKVKKHGRTKLHKMSRVDKAERALEQIEDAEEEIEDAREEVGDCNGSAGAKLLANAETHLAKAWEAYEGGDYGRAFGQAVSAEHLAENAERFAKRHLCLGGTEPDDDDDDTTTSSTTTTSHPTTTTEAASTTTTTETPTTTGQVTTTTEAASTTTTTETPTTTSQVTTTTETITTTTQGVTTTT